MREKFNTMIVMFTRFSTAIFLIDSLVLLAFKGKEAKLFATDILVILALALACAVIYTLLLSDKDFSKKKMFLMQFLCFVIIDVLVLTTGFFLNWYSFCYIGSFFAFESVIIVVCFVTIAYSYKIDSSTAKKMNEKLKSLEKVV